MDYFLLPRSEWHRVADVYADFGTHAPNQDSEAKIVAASNGGSDIAGFLGWQRAYHMEPLYIERAYRGKVDFRRLVSTLHSHLPNELTYYVFAPNRKIEGMCEHVGLQPTGWKVWKGTV